MTFDVHNFAFANFCLLGALIIIEMRKSKFMQAIELAAMARHTQMTGLMTLQGEMLKLQNDMMVKHIETMEKFLKGREETVHGVLKVLDTISRRTQFIVAREAAGVVEEMRAQKAEQHLAEAFAEQERLREAHESRPG